MDYPSMLAALYAARRLGVRFELSRVANTLAALGNPHQRIGRVIHVGGTNGKGSTAAFVDSILRASGARTGLYTSPHLCRFTERICVAGAETAADALAARHAAIRPVIGELTFFEQATILAFVTFAEEQTDAVVLEVGLGGRLDATNVIDPDVAVVTGVALDHQDVLGGTLAAIATEKAGIFKSARRAVIGQSGLPDGIPLLQRAAHAAASHPIILAPATCPWPLGLRGGFQQSNAACAIAATSHFVDEDTIRRGLASAHWPGRLELVSDVLLDAAHNPHGASALAAELPSFPRPLHAIAGVSSDKDAPAIIAPIAALSDHLWLTQAPNPRALPAADLARHFPHATVEPDPSAALAAARPGAGTVVVFGSLFLVGAVRALLTHEATDPISAQDPPAHAKP